MKLTATEEGALDIEGIPPFLFDLLNAIPLRAASEDPRAESRFFPDPARDELLVEDWKALVHPELHAAFLSAREVVLADLRGASELGEGFSMQIPANHTDAWLSALNQARLAIAEENRFGEKDMAEEIVPDTSNPRPLALFQISFYGFLQECLVKLQD
ncbi:MAG: DUF2017 family protein [Terrimicrobiaceae bacterium]|jgi:hypothetical protein|nr:DUF2017 domain-containing protein [Terrimicrobiaceae bacterium]